MIVAKPVVPNQFWILKDGENKIGNIESAADGFSVKIGGQVKSYKSISTIKKTVAINFESTIQKKIPVEENLVHGYQTQSTAYNAIYDVKHRVPLWTKEPRSKSWYAAGWYCVKQGRHWSIEFCPKLITLQRYQYQGPFYTEEQANEQRV
jgi:hypothetical protein